MNFHVWAAFYPTAPESIEQAIMALLRDGEDVTFHAMRTLIPLEYSREAKPNKMFSEEQRAAIRFVRFTKPVPCCECGKRSKTHWFSIRPFRALVWPKTQFAQPIDSGRVHIGFAPVCRDHLLGELYGEER
jgi:hypothetical protein